MPFLIQGKARKSGSTLSPTPVENVTPCFNPGPANEIYWYILQNLVCMVL